MRAWITKYALTSGITEVDGRVSVSTPSMFVYHRPGAHREFFHEKDWHTTYEAAEEMAIKMQSAKIKSLEKQIGRVKELCFTRTTHQPPTGENQ